MADIGSNSFTYRDHNDDPEPDRCPHCHGYHSGGCHRAPAAPAPQAEGTSLDNDDDPEGDGKIAIWRYINNHEDMLFQIFTRLEKLEGAAPAEMSDLRGTCDNKHPSSTYPHRQAVDCVNWRAGAAPAETERPTPWRK